jgi:tetratricopeptide (TPR) repeat protein
MGDYKNAWQSRLKSWQLGRRGERSGANWFVLADDAFASGVTLDSIPSAYKDLHGENFELWLLEHRGRWRKAIDLAKKLKKYYVACYSFQILNEMDSARHYAHIGLKSKDEVAPIYYAFLGETEKALAANAESFGSRLNTEDDKMSHVDKLGNEVLLYAFAGNYPDAVQKLREINLRYPNYNGYQDLLVGPFWEKIRREYPPFLQAINNRQQQPMPDVKKFIKL